jgi:hypothetical protein
MAASMTPDDLLRRVCESNEGYLRLGNESFEVAGATFVRNRNTPRRRDANHVGSIRTHLSDELDYIIKQAEQEFDGIPHRSFGIDPLTPPAAVARLALEDGYRTSEGLVMLLEVDLAIVTPKGRDPRGTYRRRLAKVPGAGHAVVA